MLSMAQDVSIQDACRYHRAVQGLREESRLLAANQMTLTGQYDQRRGIVTDLIHLLVTSEEPAYYIKSFEHLAAWVDGSLDQYKVRQQLSAVLRIGIEIGQIHSCISFSQCMADEMRH